MNLKLEISACVLRSGAEISGQNFIVAHCLIHGMSGGVKLVYYFLVFTTVL